MSNISMLFKTLTFDFLKCILQAYTISKVKLGALLVSFNIWQIAEKFVKIKKVNVVHQI